jgi:hypothetical protein
MKACIFAGPSLPAHDPARSAEAIWLPPAAHGDIHRAVMLLEPRAIGLVDGYFQWTPSVRHKEILWAMDRGVHVFGAASMGALRAAELAEFGMKGIGRIFEAYRCGRLEEFPDQPFEDDDEVAVTHGPAETGFLAVSEAMVNLRCTLASAARGGAISAVTCSRLAAIAKSLYFPDRTYERVLQVAAEEGLPGTELAALSAWLPAGRVNQKRDDARRLVEAIGAFLANDPPPLRPGFLFEPTTLWERMIATQRSGAPHDPEDLLVLEELRLTQHCFEEVRREALDALLLAEGPDVAHDRRHNIVQDAAPGCAVDLLRNAERTQALRRAAREVPRWLVERQMLKRLHESGDYDVLLSRAREKRARLAARSDLPDTHDLSELQLLQLRDWFFSGVLETDMPEDLAAYLDHRGYPDEAAFHTAIFEDYVYRQMSDGDRKPATGRVESPGTLRA